MLGWIKIQDVDCVVTVDIKLGRAKFFFNPEALKNSYISIHFI